MELQTLKESALSVGFDHGFVADVMEKLGPDVLTTLVDAVKSGFSADTAKQLLIKTGPTLLQIMTQLLVHTSGTSVAAKLATGELVVGEEVKLLDSALLQVLLQKFLPQLLEQFAPQLIQYILDLVTKSLTKT